MTEDRWSMLGRHVRNGSMSSRPKTEWTSLEREWTKMDQWAITSLVRMISKWPMGVLDLSGCCRQFKVATTEADLKGPFTSCDPLFIFFRSGYMEAPFWNSVDSLVLRPDLVAHGIEGRKQVGKWGVLHFYFILYIISWSDWPKQQSIRCKYSHTGKLETFERAMCTPKH